MDLGHRFHIVSTPAEASGVYFVASPVATAPMPVATYLIPIIPYAERGERLRAVLERGASFDEAVDEAARAIIEQVRRDGDTALRDLTERFDGVRPASLRVPEDALDAALDATDPDLRAIIEEAAANIRRFHEQQRVRSWFTEDGDGVVLGQRIMPMERVGLYVPGGTAAYPSSVLMNVIPAQVAGVEDIHLVSPPGADGLPHPLVLATARMLGVEHVYAVGGAQAVAALAFGTDTIPRVDKIVGPGNAYVAAAKKLVYGTVDIDSIAGPSEIVVLADDTAEARFVAADLLSQAEHDVRASAILVTPSASLAEAVQAEVERLVPGLGRRAIVEQALAQYSACVVTETMAEAVAFVNELAPEHLEIITADPWATMGGVRHAGAIFLGSASAEPVGDYFAGPNHVLPTGGTARYASALGVHDFIRRQSVIAYSEARLAVTGPRIARFADAEGLDAHALAIRVRLDAE
jgi:histidinol dehydrogenase